MTTQNDPRRIAFEILLRVEGGAFADLALDAALTRAPHLDPRDRALATELVYGVLRRRGRLDFALARLCSQPFAKIETRLAIVLRLAAYQILELDRIPPSAAVNTAVDLTRDLGLSRATGFVNGILRNLVRQIGTFHWPEATQDPWTHLVHTLSLPGWLAERWLGEFGPSEAISLATAMQEAPPFTVRVNTLKTDREQFLAALAEAGIQAEASYYAPEGVAIRERGGNPLPGLEEGWFQPQDEASQLISRLLDPQPDENVADLCAAPGGKTTHIAALTANRGRITALDLHPQRLNMIRNGSARLGCAGIETRAWDMTTSPPFLTPASFDRVLLDAPCSGLGVLRRNPETRWQRTVADIEDLAGRQGALLRQAALLVRPGGTLLYSVCTNTPEETTAVIDVFLDQQRNFIRRDLRQLYPDWSELFDEFGALRTAPHRHHGMDAFFAVRMERKG